MANISVIICTRNQAASLAQTVRSITQVDLPEGQDIEILIIDNGSLDDATERVANSFAEKRIVARYIREERLGKGSAYNAGILSARGEILIFTDDDVCVPCDWIIEMCRPIREGCSSVVVGAVKLGPAVERQWMTLGHRSWLASTERLDRKAPNDIVGASMAFSRAVFEVIPGFDPELGPGGLGFYDETLFGLQLQEAGFKLVMSDGEPVIHNCDPGRLSYRNWIDMAKRQGRSSAYVRYHWQHLQVRFVLAKIILLTTFIQIGRWTKRWRRNDPEQADPLEMQHVVHLSFLQQYFKMKGMPRNYPLRGPVKLNGVLP